MNITLNKQVIILFSVTVTKEPLAGRVLRTDFVPSCRYQHNNAHDQMLPAAKGF